MALANDIDRQPLRDGGARSPVMVDDRAVVVTGALAMKEMKDIAAARGEEWAKVEQELAKIGASPTDEVVVLSTKPGAPGPAVRVVFWAWNDGDPSAWKGIVYAEKHARVAGDVSAQGTGVSQVNAVMLSRGQDRHVQATTLGDVQAQNAFIDFLGCAADLCFQDAMDCAWLGPLGGTCFVIMCTASIIACAMVHL